MMWYTQARSQDLEKGGAILKEWEKCKRPWPEFSLFLNQFHTVCPKNSDEISRKARKFEGFFRPKSGGLQKKKKKKRSSLRHFFKMNRVARAQWRGDGPHKLVTRFGVMHRVKWKILFWYKYYKCYTLARSQFYFQCRPNVKADLFFACT